VTLHPGIKALSHAVLDRNKLLNTSLTDHPECKAVVKLDSRPIHHPNGGKDLPHYCQPGDCWCSEKLPQSNYPSGCIRIKCEYHQEKT